MTAPTIGVLALQGDVREHLRMLTTAGATALTVRRREELDRVDGLILPGGESTTMHKLAVAFELFEPLGERIREGMPAFGTCAGMIMLADRIEGGIAGQETLGGLDITVRRNAFGRQVDSFEADLDFAAFDSPFHAVLIRAPWVEKVGDGVEVLARIEAGADAGRIVAVRQGPVLATSFHPEISGDDRLHRLFVGLASAEQSSAE
ncbi:MAG TPA: pyridoxal 5'-phosphate synthase glutaminase subunit PdxT, partial [Nocardioidaceae bacterium]|nr:pyridoxal 5'-phosphate synthase glutaminase subunit PdxT [Nocardioidaceae bacterium]